MVSEDLDIFPIKAASILQYYEFMFRIQPDLHVNRLPVTDYNYNFFHISPQTHRLMQCISK
jgi:hypothetical protein